ncbi:MAG: PfkB family carbohydrate kinase [Candidatus Korobacteraceae bacterium]|jgi:sugar/nucleoside kinase (ribokinase family)
MASGSRLARPKGLFVGLATVDLTYTVEKIPRRNQKISIPGQNIAAGGPSTNAAVTFAFLGGRAALVTAVGSHPLGTIVRADLQKFDVTLRDLARRRKEPPPVSSIMVLNGTGERTVVSANAAVFSPISAEFNPRWLSGTQILQVDGQYMPLCIAAARLGRQRGIPVVLDSGSWKEGMAELLRYIDVAICSDDYRPPGCRDIDDVMEFLGARRIRRIAITRGAGPIRFVDHRESGTLAVEKIRAVDTLGAGDIFHGAFCYYAGQPGYSFRDALGAAARAATFACRYPGTRLWMEKVSR